MSKAKVWVVGYGSDYHHYRINEVAFSVSSRFRKAFPKTEDSKTMAEQIKEAIQNDFSDLPILTAERKIMEEYVRSAAGKEDLCSRTNKKNKSD